MTESTAKRLGPSMAQATPPSRTLTEALYPLRRYGRESRDSLDAERLFGEIDEYDELLERHAGMRLAHATALEINFGAHPYRQVALQSMGVDVRGIDTQPPVFSGRSRELVEVLRREGAERAARLLLRHLILDRGERRALDRALHRRGLVRRFDPNRLTVADVGDVQVAEGSLDLVVSDAAFAREPLARTVAAVARWLRPGGLALIRPRALTRVADALPRDDELTRTDYRALFAPYFEILAERVEPRSNRTLFVLRPRKA